MSMKQKKAILLGYFRETKSFPKGVLSVDANEETVGNVSVNGAWYGTFDYSKKQFIERA